MVKETRKPIFDYYHPESVVATEFRRLLHNITRSIDGIERKSFLVTSAMLSEGKSTVAAYLAITAAAYKKRKTVLIDCDLRRPTQHIHMGVPRDPGISNYIFEGADGDYARYFAATDIPTLKVLPCGAIPPSPPELIGNQKFRNLIQSLKAEFDWVLIDSPPIASLTDTIVLASLVDMVAFVVKHNENDRDLIRRCLKQLRDVHANLIGAVLNDVDFSRSANKDYYYAGYDYTRGDEAEKGTKKSRRKPSERKIAL